MTVTHTDSETEIETETRIKYVEEATDGGTVHHVHHVEQDGRIVTDCQRRPVQIVNTYEEQPRGLSGNNICYDCARTFSGGEQR